MILHNDIINVWQINQEIKSHDALTKILHNYLPDSSFEIARTKNGKPYLVSNALQFNLSHSHDMTLIAVTKNRRVGIDVQKIKPETDVTKLARRFFSTREADKINSLPATKKTQTFFTLWARKEALIKAQGLRLTDLKLNLAKMSGWSICDLDVGKDYTAAVCIHQP